MHAFLSSACLHMTLCVCVQTVDPSRGELLWMRFCSNYCYLFPLKQANCSVAGRSAPTCARAACVSTRSPPCLLSVLCRIADPSNFFSMDTFSLWRQNSFRRQLLGGNWTYLPIFFFFFRCFDGKLHCLQIIKKQGNYLLVKYNLFY